MQLIVLYLDDTPKIIMMTLYLFNTYLLSTTNDDDNTATIIVVHIDQLPYGEYNAGNCGHLDWSQYPQRIEKSPLPNICVNTSHFIYCPGNPDCDGVYLSEVESEIPGTNKWNLYKYSDLYKYFDIRTHTTYVYSRTCIFYFETCRLHYYRTYLEIFLRYSYQ
jgi:hypothetical protein